MMNARTTRTIAAAAAVACACAAAAVLVIRSPWRPRAIRIRSVRVVDAAGRPLSSLFSGMASSPQYDPRLIALARRPPSLCRQGWLDRALSYVETVVYAQSASGLCSGASCSCNGSGWVAGGGVNCPITSDGSCNSGATYNTAERDPAGQSALGNQSCGTGCGGAGCPINAFNWTVCASPGNQDCTIGEPCPNGDSDCDPGYSCTSGCCAPTPPPPPKQVGCDPNNVPDCNGCGYECFEGLFWLCNGCGGDHPPDPPTPPPDDPDARRPRAGRSRANH